MPDFIDKKPIFKDISVIDGRIYISGSVYDRKNKVSNLQSIEVSQDGVLTEKRKKLFSNEVTKKKKEVLSILKSLQVANDF